MKGYIGFLKKVSDALASPRPLETILREICRHVRGSIGGTACSVMLLDELHHELVFSEAVGLTKTELEGIRFKVGEGVAGHVAESGRGALISDVRRDKRFKKVPGQPTRIVSMMCVPMKIRGRTIGVITLTSPRRGAYTKEHLALAQTIGGELALEIENHRLFELSVTDPLTGLFNRRYFHRRLEEEILAARRFASDISVCMIDVDDFRRTNETHGHGGGDLALVTVAKVMRGLLRDYDLAARVGGDEFAILLIRSKRAGGVRVAERLREKISKTLIAMTGSRLRVTISAGVATFPRDAREIEPLLKKADDALYRAKRAGKNRVATPP